MDKDQFALSGDDSLELFGLADHFVDDFEFWDVNLVAEGGKGGGVVRVDFYLALGVGQAVKVGGVAGVGFGGDVEIET